MLDYELAQICLKHLDTILDECLIETDLFGHHGLALGNVFDVPFFGEFDYEIVCLACVTGPEDNRSVSLSVSLKLLKQFRKPGYRLGPDGPSFFQNSLRIRERLHDGLACLLRDRIDHIQQGTRLPVSQLLAGTVNEILCSNLHLVVSALRQPGSLRCA